MNITRSRSPSILSSLATFLVAAAVAVSALLPPTVAIGNLTETNGSVLIRQPQLQPAALGNSGLTGLQYADPAHSMVVMAPPTPTSQGTALVQHPLLIPPGRGIQPHLVLTYDSSAGSGWVGTAWDLSVGAISVDTRWGVPRYDPSKETETYLLDGQQLSPTAVRSDFLPRVAERSDFTFRVENSYDLIIRHGDNPRNYWWEVRNKNGGIRWYGGFPDDGGPDVNATSGKYPSLKQDPSAILFDDRGNAYRWALSAERDVGVNMIRYFYETAPGQRVGRDQLSLGRQLYLSRIRYTGAASGAPAPADDEPYEIRFLRDSSVGAGDLRKDVAVNARGGFLEVTSDLLRRVEVWFGSTNGGAERSYNVLSRRYDLHYTQGAFAKSLLSSIDQIGSDGNVYARHTFDYYDEVRDAAGAYHGWGPAVLWNTGADNLQQSVLTPVGTSVLGSSQTTSADGHAYLGFNIEDPTKEGSFGGSIAISGGTTEANAEFIDINGDGLPDKVWKDPSGIWYRPNTSKPDQPGAPVTFGNRLPVVGLNKLSSQSNTGLAGGPEAHVVVDAQFIISGDVTIGDGYFADANGDGLPDFVSGGLVYFNHINPSTGNPTFEPSSANTPVPIEESTTTLPITQQIIDLENQRRQQSPLQDTLLRWVAPFSGTVAITAPVTLDSSLPGDPVPAPPYTGDGVLVAIQQNGSQLWSTKLTTPGATATPTGVGAVKVNQGDRLYFRLQSIDDGSRDQVRWDPKISYAVTTPPSNDENGLSQSVYQQSQDFTLAGRPHAFGVAPLAGSLRFQGTLHKTKATSDDVTVQVLKNGAVVFSQLVSGSTVNNAISLTTEDPASHQGTPHPDIAVAAPTTSAGHVQSDNLEIRVAADSPIDVSAVQLDYQLYYVKTADPKVPLADSSGKPLIVLQIPANTDIYPQNSLTAPNAPWVSDVSGNVTAHVSANVGPFPGGTDNGVAFTVKNSSGLVAKQIIPVNPSAAAQTVTADVPLKLTSGAAYWFDLSIRNQFLSDGTGGQVVQLRLSDNTTRNVPSVLNWSGRQSYFPLAYRGWGFAGYNGDGARAQQPIDESAFVINAANLTQSARNPTGFSDTTYNDASKGPAYAFIASHVQAHDPSGNPIGTPLSAWTGLKDNIIGAAGLMRSSRTGVDSPSLGIPSGGSVRAVQRVGIAAPVFSLTAGIGGAGVNFGVGTSFGLQDYIDMNGAGFPSIVGPGYIRYTNPRGGFYDSGGGVSVVNQDTSFAVGGGVGISPIDIKSDSKGNVHSSQPTPAKSGRAATNKTTSSAQNGGSAAEKQYGFNVGGSFGINATFTNPGSIDGSWSGALNQTPADVTAPFELALADVNGDGLPDRVVQTPQGVFVQLNLGYSFAPQIPWSDGGFQTNESYSGTFGPQLGFSMPDGDLSAGLGLSEAINIPRYVWVDVNGDGILDRLRSDVGSGRVMVAIGTNSGLLPEVVYGTMEAPDAGTNPLVAGLPTVSGQQVALDDSKGLGGGFDFTVGIGPLCYDVCYLIVNPGVHTDHSVSNTQIALVNVTGSGEPDVVKSTADNQLTVRSSSVGRTNLLQAVHNPLGGSVRLSYQRDGNTVSQPQSVWTLSRLEVDDGRPGDGANVSASTFTYAGGRYSRLEREVLGYSSVIEHQLAADGSTVLRSIEQDYLNDNIFDMGLLASQVLKDADGKKLKQTDTTWSLIDLGTHSEANVSPTPTDPAGVHLLTMAVGPRQAQVDQIWFDGSQNPAERTSMTYDFDALGNVLKQVDLGQLESTADEATATMQYSSCDAASNPANYTRVHPSCPAPRLPGGVPPYWSSTRCPTWTSLPEALTVTNAAGQVVRQRNGAPALCDNSSVTVQHDWFGPGANDFVESLLSYDEWGNYNHIAYPCATAPAQTTCSNAQRSTVDYVYDDNSHAVVARVTDSHGLTATATFDGRTGNVASRTDANNQTTSYTYDAFGRLASITGPYEQGSGHPTVSFEYHADNPSYAYAVAHNFDSVHPNRPIDTASFVDGIGRPTQTKRNATLYTGVTSAAANVMVVSGAMDFDSLGRVVTLRYPVSEALGNIGKFNTDKSGSPSTISYDAMDRTTRVQAPGNLVTSTKYEFAGYSSPIHPGGFSANLFETTVTDALGTPQTTWADVRGNIWAVDSGAPALRTDYDYDILGQLVKVRDPGGNITTHSYDLLGRETATNTPDGGLVTNSFDGAGNLVTQITPTLRARNAAGQQQQQQVTYAYDIDRLTGIAYPADSGTPNVSYTYGGPGAPGNGAGRVIAAADGVRTQQLTYDPLGAVASEVAVINLHNGPSQPFTTSFTHDGFGRLLSVTYPDGMVLTNAFDSGGLLSSMQGVKGALVTDFLKRQEYDMFQNRRYRELGNGVHTEYSFDPNTLRLARQATTAPTRVIQDLNYAYDKVGNVLTMTNNADGPVSNLLGGPSQHTYTYDPYYRLISARGVAPVAPNKFRDYSYSVSYDASGNISSKNQCDEIVPAVGTTCGLKASQTVPETTYNLTFTYAPFPTKGPHQIATAGGNTYSYDLNGNFTQVVDSKNRVQRTVTWDAANRARNINDASGSTDYLYDAQGLLGVQRGPGGELAFVNNWYQFSNDGWFWKQIWADSDHLAQATEQVDSATGRATPLDYYEHKDLQGSVNVVTDETGAEFEHMEYFPSGEIWIHENSTTHRTPYRYVGELNDEVRDLNLLGQRWYQPHDQVFFSPEPLLYTDGAQAIDDPGLLSAYSYAESNPMRLSDPSGSAPGSVLSRLRAWFAGRNGPRVWKSQVAQGEHPQVPTITAMYSSSNPGLDYGGHSAVYLALPSQDDPNRLDYRRIDLTLDPNGDRAIEIRISPVDGRGWPDPQRSSSWEISNDQARAALRFAEDFGQHAADYKYNSAGIGVNRYNCALFSEKVLDAGGVQQSAGLLISTPYQVATGQRGPSNPVSVLLQNLKERRARRQAAQEVVQQQREMPPPAMYQDI
jgi:RHS repeat-associated protein